MVIILSVTFMPPSEPSSHRCHEELVIEPRSDVTTFMGSRAGTRVARAGILTTFALILELCCRSIDAEITEEHLAEMLGAAVDKVRTNPTLSKPDIVASVLSKSESHTTPGRKILGSADQESADVSDFHATLGITQGDLNTFNNNGLLYTNDVVKWAHGYLDGARTLSYVKTKIAGGQSSNSVIQDFGAIQSSNSAWGISRSLPSGSTLMQRGGWNAVARGTWVEIQVFHSYAYTDSGANGVWWSRKFTVRCFKVTCPYNQGIGVGGTCNNCFKLATGCSSLTNQTWSELSSCNNDGFAVL